MQIKLLNSAVVLGVSAFGGLGASVGWGQSLTIDIRVKTIGGVAPDGLINTTKHVEIAPAGTTVVMGVYAKVTGAPEQTLQSFIGSFLSTGGTERGDLSDNLTSPFNTGTSSGPGNPSDLDGDGDLDIGSHDTIRADEYFVARSGALTGRESTSGTGSNPFGEPPTLFGDPGSQSAVEYRVATLRFVVTTVGVTQTLINFVPQGRSGDAVYLGGSQKIAQTDPDTGATLVHYSGGTLGSDANFAVAPDGGVTVGVPEPATALAALTLVGPILQRRRRR